MRIVVQKFGGTSVATPENRQLVINKIANAYEQGFYPIVVVSAMGRKGDPYATDTLLEQVRNTYHQVDSRELDLVMCCGEFISTVILTATLQAVGMDAIALTGGQAGIITDSNFGYAHIQKIDPARILSLLKLGKIPVVSGFQGMTADGEFTTLGRGGSDTTAAALAAAVNAGMVEIYTDVDGIMTADPRLVTNARILDSISYSEVCQLAHQGAKVIHPRAVEIAMKKSIPLVIKSTFSDLPGTLITNNALEDACSEKIEERIVTGVTYLSNICQIQVALEPQSHDGGFKVFKAMSDHKINVDLINVLPNQVMFTVSEELLEKAQNILIALSFKVSTVAGCAKVSIVGGGMREVPGVMTSFIAALSEQAIAILQTVDSNTTISALVKQQDIACAVQSLHERFNLA